MNEIQLAAGALLQLAKNLIGESAKAGLAERWRGEEQQGEIDLLLGCAGRLARERAYRAVSLWAGPFSRSETWFQTYILTNPKTIFIMEARMKKYIITTLALMLVLGIFLFAAAASPASADESKVLEFNTMVGVPRPYTGGANAIRGVAGGGLPWIIEFGKGKLSPNGEVDVVVKGLVFDPNDQAVIDREIGGTNTVPNFKVVVSCLSKDADGNPTTVNVSTGLFPADNAGDSRIKDTVDLPSPCIAPILFVTSPGGAWFASTGY